MIEFYEASVNGLEKTRSMPRLTQKFNVGKRSLTDEMQKMIELTREIDSRFSEYVSYLDGYLKTQS